MSREKQIIILGSVITVVMLVGTVFLLGNSGQSSSTKKEANTLLNDLVGKPASDFTLESYNGDKVTLSSLKGKNVVLFFSEGLMCYPACWDQMAAFGKDTKQFEDKNTQVLVIVNDPKNEWREAIDKMPELAKATVLLDTDKKVSVTYNTLSLPSSMHKGLLPGHTYVVVDKEGIVRHVLDDPQMAIRNQQLLAEIDKF